jgi:type II secretory pathway component PulF
MHLPTAARVRADLFGLLARSERNGVPLDSALAGLASRPDPEETALTRGLTRLGMAAGFCLLLALAATWVGLIAAIVLFLAALEYGYAASRLRHLGHSLHACVTRGLNLSGAMAVYSDQFLPYEIAVVRAGERAGRLAPALAFLERFTLARRTAMLRFVRSFVYPAVMLPVAGFLVFCVAVFVVPKFFAIYHELSGTLPKGAWVLEWLNDRVVQGGGFAWMLVPVLGCLAAYLLLRLSPWRLLEWLPWLGGPVRWGSQGRFLFVLGHLLESRVPAVEAIAMAASASGSMRQWRAAMRANDRVACGQGLLDSLEAEGCLPARAAAQLRLVAGRAGFEERCMTLGSDLLETQSNWFVKVAQAAEPITVMCMVLAAGVFIASIYLTLFRLPLMIAAERF